MSLNNPPSKKKIQALLSKVTGPNKKYWQKAIEESGLNIEIQADFVKNVTGPLLGTLSCVDLSGRSCIIRLKRKYRPVTQKDT